MIDNLMPGKNRYNLFYRKIIITQAYHRIYNMTGGKLAMMVSFTTV